MRSDLMIRLPLIDESWIEEHLGELLTDATDYFDTVEPQSLEYSVGALGYARSFQSMSQQKREKFFMSDYDLQAEQDSRSHIKLIFKGCNLWEKQVLTIEDIQSYNSAIQEIIFKIVDTYAIAWARYLGISTYEDSE